MNNPFIDFEDEAQAMRRKVVELEQRIADMGVRIGVLKQDRARLALALRDLNPQHEALKEITP